MALCFWHPALAAEQSFSIPIQDAIAALAEFGRQSGSEILFEYELIRGQRTNPIEGRYTPLEALRRMTAGTRLRVSQSARGIFVIECDCRAASSAGLPESGSRGPQTSATPRAGQSPTTPSERADVGPRTGSGTASIDRLEDVIITGSRIPQDALSAPMPLMALDQAQIADSGVQNIAEAIAQLPAVTVGVGLVNSNQNIVGAGLSLISLRGLGVDRTLVLVDGRRQVSGSPLSAALDLNTIPAELVERVEVVTGGTSAVYGADAIGGVVNVILKKDFQGVTVRANSGISSRGDAASRGASLTAGKHFELGGRPGNATLSFVYDSADRVLAGSRDYASSGLDLISNPAVQGSNDNSPNFITVANVGSNVVSNAGHFTLGNQTWIFTNDGRSIRPFDFGSLGDRAGLSVGGDSVNPAPSQPLQLPISRKVLGGTFRQELPGSAELFLQSRIAGTHVESAFEPTFDAGDVSLHIDNPFLPPAAVALMQANNVDAIALHRVINEMGVRGTDNDRLMQEYVVGIEGALRNRWTYDVSYSYGHTSESTVDANDRNNLLFAQSLDAVRDPLTGQIVCRDPSNGCVPLDLVGIGHASAAAIAFSRVNSLFRRWASQQVADANLTGSLPGLPAGPLRFATGFEYRRESAASVPSAAEQEGILTLPQIEATAGGFDVREVYLEARAPLVRNRTLLEELSLNGAFRLSDYDTSGLQTAWHGGLEYEPVPGLRLRGVLSRSVRAPNVGELFSPPNQTFFFGQDPCDASVNRVSAVRFNNCLALGIPANYNAPTDGRTLAAVVGGNPTLAPEMADTWTAGLTYRPPFAPGFSLAADYWDIAIRRAIGAVPPQTIANDCVDSTLSVASNPNCALVSRDPVSHEILSISATNQNIASIHAAGLDVQLAYRCDVRPPLRIPAGQLEFDAVTTWLRRLDQLADAQDPQTLDAEQGVVGNPRWRAVGSLAYRVGDFRATWRTQFIGDARIAWFPGIPSNEYDLPDTGTKFFHDLAFEMRFGGHASVHLNVSNVFDEKPPARGFLIYSGTGTGAALYPNLGRLFFASAEYRF